MREKEEEREMAEISSILTSTPSVDSFKRLQLLQNNSNKNWLPFVVDVVTK